MINILNEDAEVVIKSFDVEKNMYESLDDEQLKAIINKTGYRYNHNLIKV